MKKLTSKAAFSVNSEVANKDGQTTMSRLLFLIGLGLCFTGVGALVGIPLIIFSLVKQSGDISSGKLGLAGNCPKCNRFIYWHDCNIETRQGRFNCPVCNVDIEYYEKNFIHYTKD